MTTRSLQGQVSGEVRAACGRALTWALAAGQLLLLSAGAEGQRRPTTSWDTLARTAQVGLKLDVVMRDSTRASGALLSIDPRGLTVKAAGASRLMPREDVVRVREAGVRGRHVRRGMLVGAVVGAVGLWAIDQQSGNPEPGAAIGMGALLFGLPGGALAGALLPIGPPLYELRGPTAGR